MLHARGGGTAGREPAWGRWRRSHGIAPLAQRMRRRGVALPRQQHSPHQWMYGAMTAHTGVDLDLELVVDCPFNEQVPDPCTDVYGTVISTTRGSDLHRCRRGPRTCLHHMNAYIESAPKLDFD